MHIVKEGLVVGNFFKYVLSQEDLSVDELYLIYEFLAKNHVSALAQKEYNKYKDHYGWPERQFLPDEPIEGAVENGEEPAQEEGTPTDLLEEHNVQTSNNTRHAGAKKGEWLLTVGKTTPGYWKGLFGYLWEDLKHRVDKLDLIESDLNKRQKKLVLYSVAIVYESALHNKIGRDISLRGVGAGIESCIPEKYRRQDLRIYIDIIEKIYNIHNDIKINRSNNRTLTQSGGDFINDSRRKDLSNSEFSTSLSYIASGYVDVSSQEYNFIIKNFDSIWEIILWLDKKIKSKLV